MGSCYLGRMRILARRTLREFGEIHPAARPGLEAWYADARHATWRSPMAVKAVYRNASILPNQRVVFNIHGNDYRLVVAINYAYGLVYIRFIGTHQAYDAIDATTI